LFSVCHVKAAGLVEIPISALATRYLL